MDEYTVDAFVNRDDPIPVITFDRDEDLAGADGDAESVAKGSKGRGLRAGLKDKLQKAGVKASEGGMSMQDRLLERCAICPKVLNFADMNI